MSSNIHWNLLWLTFWSYWFNMCVNACNHQLIPMRFVLLAQTSLGTWACSWQIKPWSIVDLYRYNSIIFWSEPLLLIFWFENCNPFVFKLWSYPDISITLCLCILSSSGWVPIITSDPLWTAKSFVGLSSDSVFHILNSREFFSDI